jgi:hypothetical protein
MNASDAFADRISAFQRTLATALCETSPELHPLLLSTVALQLAVHTTPDCDLGGLVASSIKVLAQHPVSGRR